MTESRVAANSFEVDTAIHQLLIIAGWYSVIITHRFGCIMQNLILTLSYAFKNNPLIRHQCDGVTANVLLLCLPQRSH